jgi:hypothetical protein
MARKISLWISTLYTPITKSPSLPQGPSDVNGDVGSIGQIPWTLSDENADTLVTTSPQIDRRPERKESLGAGAVVRELLIKDLE